MKMKEWNNHDLSSFFDAHSTGLLYLYTPLCGTCQVASRMLQVIEQLVSLDIGKMNLNYFPEVAMKYGVESVPCLLFVKDGQVVQTLYAFHSVPYLLEKIKDLLPE